MMAVTAGSTQAQTESSGVTTNNNATGNAYGYFTTNIGGSGEHPPPYAPGIITAPIAAPTLFSINGLPAQVKNFPMLMNNYFSTAHHDVAIGCSRGTKIIYNSAIVAERPKKKDRQIFFDFNGLSQGELVGSLTIQSRKDRADEVDVPTLIYDATRYIDDVPSLKGYNITLLSMNNTLTYSMGVDTRASGMAASPYVSGFINGPAGVLAGVVPSISKSGGVTVPTAIIGCTFLVLIDSEKSRRVDIRPNYGAHVEPVVAPVEESSSNGNSKQGTLRKKKFEAEEER